MIVLLFVGHREIVRIILRMISA